MEPDDADEANALAGAFLEIVQNHEELVEIAERLSEFGIGAFVRFVHEKPPSKKKLRKLKKLAKAAKRAAKKEERRRADQEKKMTVKEAKALNAAQEKCPVCGKATMHGLLVSREKTEDRENVPGPQLRRVCQNPECRFGDAYPVT